VWPAEYIILLVRVVRGAVIYAIAPTERDEQALRALLGDQYEGDRHRTQRRRNRNHWAGTEDIATQNY